MLIEYRKNDEEKIEGVYVMVCFEKKVADLYSLLLHSNNAAEHLAQPTTRFR